MHQYPSISQERRNVTSCLRTVHPLHASHTGVACWCQLDARTGSEPRCIEGLRHRCGVCHPASLQPYCGLSVVYLQVRDRICAVPVTLVCGHVDALTSYATRRLILIQTTVRLPQEPSVPLWKVCSLLRCLCTSTEFDAPTCLQCMRSATVAVGIGGFTVDIGSDMLAGPTSIQHTIEQCCGLDAASTPVVS